MKQEKVEPIPNDQGNQIVLTTSEQDYAGLGPCADLIILLIGSWYNQKNLCTLKSNT